MLILLGPGLFHLVEVDKLPESGDILNLGGVMQPGRYKVERRGEATSPLDPNGERCPYFTYKYVSEIPKGEEVLPQALVSI